MRIRGRPKKERLKENSIFPGLILVVIGGMVFMNWGWPPVQQTIHLKDWPSVNGEIIRSEIYSERNDGKTQYRPDIVYTYHVDGRSYVSSNLTMGDPRHASSLSTAKRAQAEYPVGRNVNVYYDPDLPSSSVLEPGVQEIGILLLVITGLFPVLGILMFVMGMKAKRDRQKTITLRVLTKN
jgi:hypothetical protein